MASADSELGAGRLIARGDRAPTEDGSALFVLELRAEHPGSAEDTAELLATIAYISSANPR